MKSDQRTEVHVHQIVAIKHNELLSAQFLFHFLYRARRAQQFRLVRIGDFYAESASVTEVAGDFLRQIMQVDDDLANALSPEQFQMMFEQRFPADRYHHLRYIQTEGPQP